MNRPPDLRIRRIPMLTRAEGEGARQSAVIDPTGRYRYSLIREWASGPWACWIMLNPSTADAEVDDPTIRRCVGFSRSWGFDGLEVVNLFAFRTSDPRRLKVVEDPVGPDNDKAILRATARASQIIAAWGSLGLWRGRGAEVLSLLGCLPVFALTVSHRTGQPGHPLYLPSTIVPRTVLQAAAAPR